MANTASAKKYIRSSARRRKINDMYRRRYRELIKKITDLLKEEKFDQAQELYPQAQKAIDKAVKRGVLKQNNGSRRKAKLAKRVFRIGA